MVILPSDADVHEETGPLTASWSLSDVREVVCPGDSVLVLSSTLATPLGTLAALAGWVTFVPEPGANLAELHARVHRCGWPNITLAPTPAEAERAGPFDVVLTSDGLSRLTA